MTRDELIAKAAELVGRDQPIYSAEIQGRKVTLHFPWSIETVDTQATVPAPKEKLVLPPKEEQPAQTKKPEPPVAKGRNS